MKHAFYILGLFISLHSYAQVAIERSASMSLGLQNGFYVEIPGADKKMAQSALYDFVKVFGKMKENGKAKEHFLMAVQMPKINGSSPIDFYAKIEEGKGMTTTYVWVDMKGSFANSKDHMSQTEGIKQFLRDYFFEVRKKVVDEEIKAEEKTLSNMDKDLKKLQDKKRDFEKEIEKAKAKIIEMEKNIDLNIKEQENKSKTIENQKEQIKSVVNKRNNLGKED